MYNLQLGNNKLLHIVLFGQPELNDKLGQPNMRQLKDRIVHHFSMLPLSKSVIIAYLIFRMRAAGYHGPNVFSIGAVKLIGAASNGLMRRVNILADKALLAAFIENTHSIEVRHIQAAIRDSELSPPRIWQQRTAVIASTIVLLVTVLAGISWFFGSANSRPAAPIKNEQIISVAPSPSVAAMTTPDAIVAATVSAVLATSPPAPPAITDHDPPQTQALPSTANLSATSLLAQRLTATKNMLAQRNKNSASIQLFFTTEARPERLENFLDRANNLGKLDEIYVLPSKINGKDGYRVLYGDYPDMMAARSGMLQLPPRYRTAFSPVPYMISMAQVRH